MQRLKRKFRDYSELKILSSGGIMDATDNAIKASLRIDDDEFDFICSHLTDEQHNHLFDVLMPGKFLQTEIPKVTFNQKRKLINLLDDLLTKYEEQQL